MAYEIVELEKLIESQYITRSLTNRTATLVEQASSLLKDNQFCSHMSNLSLQLYERLIKAGYVKNDEDYRSITKFFYEQLPSVSVDQLDFRENYGTTRPMYGIVSSHRTSCRVLNIPQSGWTCSTLKVT